MPATRILLLRVGMDLGFGGLGPIFPDGRFEYVPIPERKPSERSVRYSQIAARYCNSIEPFVPKKYRGGPAHYDPEFTNYTYGDPTPIKRRQLMKLKPGDILAFSAGLRPPKHTIGSRVYLIGYFVVKEVHRVIEEEPWPTPSFKRLWSNAHFRRNACDEGLVLVEGTPRSRLFDSASQISDDEQFVLPMMQTTLGLSGSIRRGGRWIPDSHVAKVEKWLTTL